MAYEKKRPTGEKSGFEVQNKNRVEPTELPEGVVKDDDGVYVEEVSGKPLSDDPKYVPEPVEEPVNVFNTAKETEPKEVKNGLNTKIRDKIDELTGQGKSVVYPTNESNWDQALLDRLNKA